MVEKENTQRQLNYYVKKEGYFIAWRLHDLIHFHLTDIRISDLQTEENSLVLLDKLLGEDHRDDCWLTFSPQYQEILDAFKNLVLKDFRNITTFGQVRNFVEFCFTRYYEKSNESLDLDEMLAQVCEQDLAEDLLVIIEFED